MNNRRLALIGLIATALLGAIALFNSKAAYCAPAETADSAAESPAPRADFLRMIDRPRVALEPVVGAPGTIDNLSEIHFSYLSEAAQRVPGILVKPPGDAGPRPVVIVLHGTGGNKVDELPFLLRLAKAGFIGVAVDGRYHGERAVGVATIPPMNAYETKIFQTFEGRSQEHPLYYDTVWDVMRLIDYLQTRQDVDGNHIGVYGISKGGIETYLLSAADPRVAAAVPAIGVQTFQWGLDHDAWYGRVGTFQKAFDAAAKAQGITKPDSAFARTFYDNVIPGIDDEFDGPSFLPLIAPRPLLVIVSDNDPHTPMGGVYLATAAARAAYHQANLDDHFSMIVQHDAGHQVLPSSQRAVIEFFAKWLMPKN
jgi:dienelactone hydrolase